MKAKLFENKRIIVFVVVSLIIICISLCNRDFFQSANQLNYSNIDADLLKYIEADNKSVKQYFKADKDICSASVYVVNEGNNPATILAEIIETDSEKVMDSEMVEVPGGMARGDEAFPWYISFSTEDITKGKSYYLQLSVVSGDEVYYEAYDASSYFLLTVDGEEEENTVLRFLIFYGYEINWSYLIFVDALIIAILWIILYADKNIKQEVMFLIISLIVGILFAVVIPMANECDGWTHIKRSFDASYGNVLGSFVNLNHEKGYIEIPENLDEFRYNVISIGMGQAQEYKSNLMCNYFSSTTKIVEYDGETTAFYYWPQALGIFIARCLNLNMYWTILLSRLMNLCAYISIVYFAIKLMPIYKNLMLGIVCMPLALHQAASDSPDSLLIALCALFIGFCFYLAYEKPEVDYKDALKLGLLLAIIFVCKYVYVFIGLLVLIIPRDKFDNKNKIIKSLVVVVIPVIIIGALLAYNIFSGILVTTAVGDTGTTQLGYLKGNPSAIIKVLWNTFYYEAHSYINLLNSFGSMRYYVGLVAILYPAYLCVVTVLDCPRESKVAWRHKLIFFLAFALAIVGVWVALYVSDGRINPVAASQIAGGQGRYLIPVMILLFMLFGSNKVTNNIDNYVKKNAIVVIIMNLYVLLSIIFMVY